MRNIELKARLDDLAAAQAVAAALVGAPAEIQQQTDTYFVCPAGRLKLREIEGQPAELIWYARPDQPSAKASDYLLARVADAEALRNVLIAGFGTRGVVRKRREIYRYHNVRIHLDTVAGLGTFLEFEAEIGSASDDDAGHRLLAELSARFSLKPQNLLARSYGDMVE